MEAQWVQKKDQRLQTVLERGRNSLCFIRVVTSVEVLYSLGQQNLTWSYLED